MKNKKIIAAVLSAFFLLTTTATAYAVPAAKVPVLAKQHILDTTCAPSGITMAADGGYLVTDLYNKVVWKVKDGKSVLFAGKITARNIYGEPYGGYKDGASQNASFQSPWAIVPFMNGYAVSDSENNVVRLIQNTTTKTVVGSGKAGKLDGVGVSAAFSNPTGLATDGSLYIADTNNDCIRKVTTDGKVSTYVTGLSAPTGLYFSGGSLYVAESGAHRIVKLTNGVKTVVAGTGTDDFADGAWDKAAFSSPQGIAVAGDGTVYVSDTGNSAIRKIANGKVTTLLQNDAGTRSNDLVSPRGLVISGDKLLVGDVFSKTIYEVTR